MRRLLKPLWILLALIFLFEAWLWRQLAPFFQAIVDRIPWRWFKERLRLFIEGLSPAATLLVFLAPIVLLVPLKFLGLWLLGRGSWLGATALLVLAKLIGMGMTAFIFDVTKPKLLRMAWFSWLHGRVLICLAWAHAMTDPYKRRVQDWIRDARRELGRLVWLMKPSRPSRFLRRLARLHRRAHSA